EIWSAILSGWPSVTDSEVNEYERSFGISELTGRPFGEMRRGADMAPTGTLGPYFRTESAVGSTAPNFIRRRGFSTARSSARGQAGAAGSKNRRRSVGRRPRPVPRAGLVLRRLPAAPEEGVELARAAAARAGEQLDGVKRAAAD